MVISRLNSKEEVGFGLSVCNHHLFPAKGILPQWKMCRMISQGLTGNPKSVPYVPVHRVPQ